MPRKRARTPQAATTSVRRSSHRPLALVGLAAVAAVAAAFAVRQREAVPVAGSEAASISDQLQSARDLRRMPPETDKVADAGKIIQTVISPADFPSGPPPKGMVWIPPGRFSMGSAYRAFEDARPIHTVEVEAFWMDETPVTNEEFDRFVKVTNYVSVAERPLDPKEFPGVPEEKLQPGSIVFSPPKQRVALDDLSQWWSYTPGASWRHPEGPGSDLKGREKHPVVHVAWEDAAAYAKWAGKRLPTEAEWEWAARAGLTQKDYVWGDELRPGGKHRANTWQGEFPSGGKSEDGWIGTSPVRTFPPNAFGLYDMAGNVWQWCSDWYRPDYYAVSPLRAPKGPPDSYDPAEPGIPKRAQRGGSFLCSDQYCSRYMPGGRGKGAVDSGASHVGFRCVASP